jgi:hypothetical protein
MLLVPPPTTPPAPPLESPEMAFTHLIQLLEMVRDVQGESNLRLQPTKPIQYLLIVADLDEELDRLLFSFVDTPMAGMGVFLLASRFDRDVVLQLLRQHFTKCDNLKRLLRVLRRSC